MAFEPIAIVGRACVLPGALSPEQLWALVSAGRDAVSAADPGRWGLPAAEVAGEGPDRTWHDRGGYVRGFESVWDPEGFAVPAAELDGLDPLFLWVLHCAREALADAGDARRGGVERPRVGALFGNLGFPTAQMSRYAEARWMPELEAAHGGSVDPRNRFMGAGAAALLERALGLKPGVYGLDTACASSLVAIKLACDQLHDRRADRVLAGAVNRADDLFLHVGFSALSALSPSGSSRPFHAEADGLLPAEGAGFVALERLSDARRHGRRIYGVIRGVGLSNDGRGRGFLAPSQAGQVRALRQAYALAEIRPSAVELLECHATGTKLGDAVELRSSAEVLGEGRGPGQALAIGSLKSNFGHAITAAGVAGLIKVLEAMRHGQRPPTLHARGHENPALADAPFRLLHEAEPWPEGPRVAAVSAFGFGGNNAHVVVSAEHPSIELGADGPSSSQLPRSPLAVVGVGTVVGQATSAAELAQAVLGEAEATRETKGASLDLAEVRFPPKALEQTLAQQLLVLRAAREAMAEAAFDGELARERCGVFMGLEPDAEICRHGARWRLAHHLQQLDAAPTDEALAQLRDRFVGPLEAAGVVGTMPNIPANRLNAQFDLGGHSCTVFAGEASGRRALELAGRALRAGELDAAIVAASDLSCEPVHRAALAAIEGEASEAGDASIALVVRRLDDARREGQAVLAILDESEPGTSAPVELDREALRSRFGRSYAAGDLRDLAAALLGGRHGLLPDGRAWPSKPPVLRVPGPPGGEAIALRPLRRPPALLVYAASTPAELAARLASDAPGGEGSCRAAIVAGSELERARRLARARGHLEQGSPTGPGVFVRRQPIGGELALVFNGAGAAYEDMARPLLDAVPGLDSELRARCPELAAAYDAAWGEGPAPLQKLWSSSFVAQVHAALSLGRLGLKPNAVVGYSSGESNSLFAAGIWTDHDDMVRACRDSGVFTEEIGGEFRAVARAWGRDASEPIAWQTWTVLAPIAEVEAALADEPRVRLTIVHSDAEVVIAGEAEACARVCEALGASRCVRLHYDLAVHLPELAEIREAWLDLHRRPVSPRPDLRVYSGAHAGAYTPSTEACAAAILGQADRRLDFRAVIEQAYADGVRVFVEHGPLGACSRWIREILGERDAVIVALDRRGGGVETIVEAVAALVAAGVAVNRTWLAPDADSPALNKPAFELRFDAHPPSLDSLELPQPQSSETPMSANEPTQIMPPAPALPAVGAPVPALELVAPVPGPAPTPTIAPAVPSPPTPPSPGPTSGVAAVMQTQLAALGEQQRQFIAQQSQLHRQFLALHTQQMNLLASAAQARGTMPPPAFGQPLAPPPVAPRPPVSTPRVPVSPLLAASPVRPEPRPAPAPRPAAKPTRPTPAPQPSAKAARPGPRPPVGPTFERSALEVHASGNISEIFGPQFVGQDRFHRQVRMPEPPLLLADRVTGLDAEPMSMKLGTIWTETDVRDDAWYIHEGYMPAGIMIESGQADLMLISYLGVDAENKSERVYRLLGCTLTYHGGLPKVGETLCYDIHLDGHAKQGDTRLMFFHYDCHIDGKPRLTVRKGQAGFFTDEELANSDGCIWTPEGQEIVAEPRLDPPDVVCEHASLSPAQLRAFAEGRPWDCFGSGNASDEFEGWDWAKTHTRTPRVQAGRMLFFDRVDELAARGGPWGRGYLRASTDIEPDHWFFEGHFLNDPCMPGTLMLEGCLQTVAVFLASLGYTVRRDGWRFEPVQDEAFVLSCRGQVTPEAKHLSYEVFVEEIIAGPIPTVYADLLCTVDGLKAFHARRVGLRLVPAWPLDEGHARFDAPPAPADPAIATAEGHPLDFASLLACAQGRPSSAFGPVYQRFDTHESVARLPNPPYHFISRVAELDAEQAALRPGGRVTVEWDVEPGAWFLAENGNRSVPYAVLLEAALQPCGWLASYIGGALASAEPLMFRNLDGTAAQHVELLEDAGTLRTEVHSTSVSKTVSMVIVGFRVECFLGETLAYSMDTVFGFFPATAFEDQAGLPTSAAQRDLLTRSSTLADGVIELDGMQATPGRARMARPMLLMLDRVCAFEPEGGEAGLGFARADKTVDPDEWFFKAHFFQDPVQPGSLGIEAMIQLLQWTMLELGMDADMAAPRFEAIGLGEAMTWKYRGQVVPTNETITTTLEIVERGHDQQGAYAKASASLWVDGKRIYEATNLAMRIVDDASIGDGRTIVLDPAREAWIGDHCPTYAQPALPMMSMVDLLARATRSDERLLGLRELRVKGWLTVEQARTLRVERDRQRVELRVVEADGSERLVAEGQLVTGRRYDELGPTPFGPLEGEPVEASPYDNGVLFHGPAFHLLERLVQTPMGASSILDLDRVDPERALPFGAIAPALLDAATHGIPHDRLSTWRWPGQLAPSDDKVAYPAWIPELELFGPTPRGGKLRCEARPAGFVGSADFPAIELQLIHDDPGQAPRVWCRMRLVEACFPKGRLGLAAPADRLAFLRDHRSIPGLSLSEVGPARSELKIADLDGSDWLPGTVAHIYGTSDPARVVAKEHIAAAHGVHPRHLPEALPLTRFELDASVDEDTGIAQVSGEGRGRFDLSPVRDYWTQWFDRGPWPVEDLYYGLIDRFVERVVVEDPEALAAIRGRGAIFLANHQVAVESLLFSVIASALTNLPTVTLAKIEHKTTWLGQLIEHCFSYPGVRDPGLIAFFDREDKNSLRPLIVALGQQVAAGQRSMMVHIEGTRSLTCAKPVEKMSGAFLDLAIAIGAPVVPVRFVGALPVEPLNKRIEFPTGMGTQDIWFGRPIAAAELATMPYGERKRLVIDAINGLGPANADERPYPGNPEFAADVDRWAAARGIDQDHATLRQMLAERDAPGEAVQRLLAADSVNALSGDDTPEGQWLVELGRRLLGSE